MVTKSLVLLCILFLSSCVMIGGSFCDLNSPIRPSPEELITMSDEAVQRNLAINFKGQKICGWKP